MAQQSVVANPFMLMVQPEVVLAAIENSERLGRLNKHLCRPLDRPVIPNVQAAPGSVEDDDTDETTSVEG